jgi:DNA-binding NarL/FixJ family response regulator
VPIIRAGALGYVTKTIETAELVAAIARVEGGDARSVRHRRRAVTDRYTF